MAEKSELSSLTEVEALDLQTGMIIALDRIDKTLQRDPSSNKLHVKDRTGASGSNVDTSRIYPMSIVKSGQYGTGCSNSFSEPYISLKDDKNFIEYEAWELRSNVKEKDFVSKPPLFRFVFCDWINIEGKSEAELANLQNYGDHPNSFFKINDVAKARADLFYLVINVRIVNMRHSVFIFACKKEEWDQFLHENLKNPNECDNEKSLLEILRLCMKVKVKFWTIPTMGALKNPFMMNKTLEKDCYHPQLFPNRMEVYVDQNGMKFPMLLKPIWNLIVKMTAGITSNMQCFDIAYFLEAGEGDNHKFLFNYPERLLGVVRGEKMEWHCARKI